MPNPYVDALRAELVRAGIVDFVFQMGGKHPRVVYQHNGQRRMFVYPGSGSDGARGVQNSVAGLRRQLGIVGPRQSKSTRPPKRRTVRPDEAPESFAVRPNPLLALKDWKPPTRPTFRWVWRSGNVWAVERL